VICIVRLSRYREADPWKVALWSWAFALLAVAAGLGAVVHGLEMSEQRRALLWQPLFLSLGLVVGLFVVAAVQDWKGRTASRRLLPIMLVAGAGFFGLTRIASGTFLVFVAYEAVAMLLALGVYGSLAANGKLRGAAVVAVAIVLNIVAAGIQASGSVAITLGVPFDHNGLFHIVQAVAVVVLVKGLEQGLTAHAESHA
jgi:hypothetical protein